MSLVPLVVKLLEAVFDSIHGPVLLRLDSLALLSSDASVVVTDILREVVTKGLEITIPVRTINSVDTVVLIPHDGTVGNDRASHRWRQVGHEARCELNDLVDVVSMELFFHVSKTVEHLDRALRVANVEDLLDAGLLFDHLDVGYIVIEAHVSPREHPVVVVILRGKRLVVPRVHRAAIITDPDIVAGIDEQQVEWSAIEVCHP